MDLGFQAPHHTVEAPEVSRGFLTEEYVVGEEIAPVDQRPVITGDGCQAGVVIGQDLYCTQIGTYVNFGQSFRYHD